MIDFEKTNEANAMEENDKIDKTSSDINQKTENSETAYGVIYVPGENGPEYVSKYYNVNDAVKTEQSDLRTKDEKKKAGKKKLRIISLISAIVVLTVLISSISAFFAAYLTKQYYEDILKQESSPTIKPSSGAINDNRISFDKTPPAYHTQTIVPGELMNMEQAIAAVKDSVVEITTERVQNGFGSFSQYVVSGAGSGVIISTSGYIITNNHVIEGASNITVRLTNGKEYNATLIGTDSKTDIAVISIIPEEGDLFPAAVIGSSEKLLLGQTVIAIGNPLGKLGGTVSDGIISCLAREIAMEGSGTMSLLQTNAAVSPGNSGGGLFDLYGRLIGVVNAKSTGEGVEGISFAIPIDTAWNIAVQLIDKGYVSGRPSLGVSINQVNMGSSIFGISYTLVIVTDSKDNSNLKNNDTIYAIDNIEIASLTDVSEVLSRKKVGDSVTVTVLRDRKYIDVEVTLVEYVPTESDTE